MIAAEYGWSLGQILDLTPPKLNVLLERIGDRRRREMAVNASMMKFAIVAAVSKEGSEAFQSVIEELCQEEKKSILAVSPETLKEFGIGKGKNG